MARSPVQTIQTTPSPRPDGWVIDAAPNRPPYWELLDYEGHRRARMFLCFRDRDEAKRAVGREIDSRHGELRGHITRSLYNLRMTNAAVVRRVRTVTQELEDWARDIVDLGGGTVMPGALDQPADVVLLPRELTFVSGRLAVVDEHAMTTGRVCFMLRPDRLDWT